MSTRAEAGPRTLFDKVFDQHVVTAREDGQCLLFIDRHLLHEGSFHAFDKLKARGARIARSDLTFGIEDHYVPTRTRDLGAIDPAIANMIRQLRDNTAAHGLRLFGLTDPAQGIVHVVGPEQGLTLPGLTIVCGDSHTATHGAFGAIAFGIGASEVAHVLMTQTLWQKKPKRMRIRVEGGLAPGVFAKDMALSIIATIGADGAAGHAIEYAGSAVRALSMEGRLTLCNLSIEAGGRCGMIAPDDTTVTYIKHRPYAPAGHDFRRGVEDWMALASDPDAAFDREVVLDAHEIAPIVTWGISPEDAAPITANAPDPDRMSDTARAAHVREALDYMGIRPGQPLTDIAVDRVFIGRRARVPGLVSPGSAVVKRQAEEEGLHRIFTEAGLEWVDAGCSMCVGMNGDLVPPGERCASTTNRNFRGRQGPGSRTHLMSPAMAAAAAVTGHLTDMRPLLAGRTTGLTGEN